MSFVITAPEIVTAAAGNLAGIGSTLVEAAAAAAAPTVGVAAAAADEVSIAISRLFGTYGQEFQTLSAQAAAFQVEFVRLLNSGAAAYLAAEITNAEQNLFNAPAQALLGQIRQGSAALSLPSVGVLNAAAVPPLLVPVLGGGGLLGPILGGGTGGFLPVLSPLLGGGLLGPILNVAGTGIGSIVSTLLSGGTFSLLSDPISPLIHVVSGALTGVPGLPGSGLAGLLSGLFAPTGSSTPPAGTAYQILFANTVANLQNLGGAWAAHPFPFLQQVLLNQQGYWQEIVMAIGRGIQDLPVELANFPAEVQAAIQGFLTASPAAALQQFVNGQIGYVQTVNTSLQSFGQDLGAGTPAFQSAMGTAYQALMGGDFSGAVNDATHGFLNLFITGFDTSDLSDIKVLGPAGDLLPIFTIPGQEAQTFTNLLPTGSILARMAQNFTNVATVLGDPTISTTISADLSDLLAPQIELNAFFGLPLSVLFGIAGPPVAGLDAFATSAATIGQAVQVGNFGAAVGGLIDAPAVIANGFLNGETLIDLTMNVAVGPISLPVVMHLPFDGLLVPPHPITATVPIEVLGTVIPLNLTLGGTPFSGLAPMLLNYVPQKLAEAITPA